MRRFTKKSSLKTGQPPGTLTHIGEKKQANVNIKIIDYDVANVSEYLFENIEDCIAFKDKTTVSWINVDGLHDLEVMKNLGSQFGIHNLVMEDVLNTNLRPAIEDYGNYIYMTFKMLYQGPKIDTVLTEQVSLLIFENMVISFQEIHGDVFDSVRERIKNAKGRIRKGGADYLAYSLIDSVVDSYFLVLENMAEHIGSLEEELLNNVSNETLKKIHLLKSEIVFLKKVVFPVRDLVAEFSRTDAPLLHESTHIYLRDLYQNVIQLIDTVEAFREMASGMLDTYISMESKRTNDIMKILTIMATIFIPLTFIAGVYGMNFDSMPELHSKWGYPAILLFMVLVAGGLVYYFKTKKWL